MSSPRSFKPSIDSRIPKLLPSDRFCQFNFFLGGETEFWCFLLSYLYRIPSSSFLKDNFDRYSILGLQFFFLSALWIYHSNPFRFLRFLLRNRLIIMEILWAWCHFSLAAFKVFSLSLTSDSLIIMCLGLGFFGLILIGSFEYLQFECQFPSIDLQSFGHYLSKQTFCPFLSSSSGTPIMCFLNILMSFRLSSLFLIVPPLVNFSIQLLYSLALEFLFCSLTSLPNQRF